jgi:copper chaperone
MKTLQFKTNINCGGCVAKITSPLNEETSIKNWQVDTANPQKILTVETEELSAKQIIEVVNKAGFKAEVI